MSQQPFPVLEVNANVLNIHSKSSLQSHEIYRALVEEMPNPERVFSYVELYEKEASVSVEIRGYYLDKMSEACHEIKRLLYGADVLSQDLPCQNEDLK